MFLHSTAKHTHTKKPIYVHTCAFKISVNNQLKQTITTTASRQRMVMGAREERSPSVDVLTWSLARIYFLGPKWDLL